MSTALKARTALHEADAAGSGAVLPTQAGYDVFLLIGQSNMVGYSGSGSVDLSNFDVHDANIWQYAGTSILKVGYDPLAHNDGGGNGVGPGMTFARWWATTHPGRRVLLVPAAVGGTGFTGTPPSVWDSTVNPSLYTTAVAAANAAIAAAKAIAPTSAIAGILWMQGETDGWSNRTQAQYAANLDALIDALRSNISGATPQTPFILGRMVPEFVGSAGSGTSDQIDKAHADTPRRKAYTWVAEGPSGSTNHDGTNIYHYTAPGARLLGQRMFFALTGALANQATGSAVPNPPAYPKVVQNGTTGTTLTWLPAVANAAVTGYEVWRGTAAGGETLLATLGNVLTYSDNTANSDGTTYYYKIRAINAIGASAFSDELSIQFILQTLIAADTFNRANTTPTPSASTLGTTDTGAKAWTYREGYEIYIDTNQAMLVAINGASWATVTIDAGVANTDQRVKINTTGFNGDQPRLLARFTDLNNFLSFGAYNSSAYYLAKVVGGVETQLTNPGFYSGPVPAAGDVIRFVVKGTTVTGYVNGVQVLQVTDATLTTTATNVGLRGKAGSFANKFDDYFCYTAP